MRKQQTRSIMTPFLGTAIWQFALLIALCLSAPVSAAPPKVSAPPASFFAIVQERDREAARAFYKKYLDVNGLPVVSAGEVADTALQRTHEIVSHLLAGRPDVLTAMAKDGMYLIIIGINRRLLQEITEEEVFPIPSFAV